MNPNPTPAPAPRVRPAHEIRLAGIKAAIWRNDTEAGVRFNVTFERLYRDAETWKSSASFGRDDLLLLAKVADHAHTWILTQGREAGTQAEPEAFSTAGMPRI